MTTRTVFFSKSVCDQELPLDSRPFPIFVQEELSVTVQRQKQEVQKMETAQILDVGHYAGHGSQHHSTSGALARRKRFGLRQRERSVRCSIRSYSGGRWLGVGLMCQFLRVVLRLPHSQVRQQCGSITFQKNIAPAVAG